ncbi:cytochrome P450 [Macrophomina phaseolina]|uniref:Cytochrome P450 n=1 Tax=Macrophomina phaseolina TaxID=35725 RepID=A0ABQ8G8B5_9PEZI|nr:cytochrome P450 [Macrophomina phaseolina]
MDVLQSCSTNALIFLFLCGLGVFLWRYFPWLATETLSFVINRYLLFRYPIRRHGSGIPLPSCEYRWPNGQGDRGKFLDGIANSSNWEKKYGTIYRIWSGMKPEIVLTRAEHLRTVFKDSNNHMKAVDNHSGYLMSRILGQCVGLVSQQQWETVRKVTEGPFTRKASSAYVQNTRVKVREYLKELKCGPNLSQGKLHPAWDMKMLPFLVVADIIYGRLSADMVHDLRELAPLREELFLYVIKGGIARFHWSQYLPTRANALLAQFRKRWRAFNEWAYQRAKDLQNGAPIIAMFEAAKSGEISEEQLLQTLDETLYANLDVTTGALSWNLVFFAAYPHVQDKVRAEIASRADDMEAYILSSSSYLAACIAESSRLRPLAAFSVPQSAPTDRVVDGYLIPAGTNFVVDSYALNIRHGFWGADAEEYRPERWVEMSSSDLRYHFWRFGFGPRQCMGKYVADIILRALYVELLSDHRLDLLDKDQDWSIDPNSWITHPQFLLACKPLA